jgi:Zn-finger nucleic acid-binding protein
MDEMTCPKCTGTMRTHRLREVTVARCSSCSGIFLDRADLGALSDAENDWHAGSGPHTEPLPRITADMTAPPPPAPPRANSFVETLFS